MNRQRKGARTALSASPGSSVRADMAVRAPGNGSWKERESLQTSLVRALPIKETFAALSRDAATPVQGSKNSCLQWRHVKSSRLLMTHVKLHIPGPVEVSEKTFRAFCSPMIGHRGQGFKDLYATIQPRLQALFHTKQLVFLSTSSAWGVMEGALRNLVARKVLTCMCGAFSDKWLDVARRSGKEAEPLQVPWGSPICAVDVEKKLATGGFDAMTLIHNETSTGVMSRLAEIAALKKKFPDVMFIVDSVSSMTAVPLNFDELGIDVLLAGTQKAFALPPGLTIFVCSPAALATAGKAKD